MMISCCSTGENRVEISMKNRENVYQFRSECVPTFAQLLYRRLQQDYKELQEDHLNLTRQWRSAVAEADDSRQLGTALGHGVSDGGGSSAQDGSGAAARPPAMGSAGRSKVTRDGTEGSRRCKQLMGRDSDAEARQDPADLVVGVSGRVQHDNGSDAEGGQCAKVGTQEGYDAGLHAQSCAEDSVRGRRSEQRRCDEVLDLLIKRETAALVSSRSPPSAPPASKAHVRLHSKTAALVSSSSPPRINWVDSSLVPSQMVTSPGSEREQSPEREESGEGGCRGKRASSEWRVQVLEASASHISQVLTRSEKGGGGGAGGGGGVYLESYTREAGAGETLACEDSPR